MLTRILPITGLLFSTLISAVSQNSGLIADRVFPASAESENERIQVSLRHDSKGGALLFFSQGGVIEEAEWVEAENGVFAYGCFVSKPDVGEGFELFSRRYEIILSSPAADGFAAKLPVGKPTGIQGDPSGNIRILPQDGGSEPVVMRFPDGGRAEVADGASCRYETIGDGQYLFFGSGDVYALNAEGQPVALSPYGSPMAGGPVVRETRSVGETYFRRSRPVASVEVHGFDDEGSFVVAIDGVRTPFSGDGPHLIRSGSGATVELTVDSARGAFSYSVPRGDARITIAGIPGWEARGVPGDSVGAKPGAVNAEVSWNAGSKIVDIENLSGDGGVVVGLPAETSVRLAPGALFQYSHSSGSTYSTSATGAPVTLFSQVTGTTTDLTLANLIVKSGLPIRPDSLVASGASQNVRVAWQPGSMLVIKVGEETFTMPPGSEEALVLASGGRFDVTYDERSEIGFSSGAGAYVVETSSFQTWKISVPEGQQLGMSKSINRDIFTISASPENYTTLQVQGTEGPFPLLYPGAVMNFISGRDPTLISANSGVTIFYESAGSGPQQTLAMIPEPRWPSKPGTTPPPFGRLNDILDLEGLFGGPIHGAIGKPRIDQPPETGF